MEPISAGTALAIYGTAEALKGIMGAWSGEQARQREIAAQKSQGTFDMTQNMLGNKQQMQQGALSDLIAAYRSNLGGAK